MRDFQLKKRVEVAVVKSFKRDTESPKCTDKSAGYRRRHFAISVGKITATIFGTYYSLNILEITEMNRINGELNLITRILITIKS